VIENLQDFLNLHYNFQFNAAWHSQFSVRTYLLYEASRKQGHLSRHQSCVCIDYVGDIIA